MHSWKETLTDGPYYRHRSNRGNRHHHCLNCGGRCSRRHHRLNRGGRCSRLHHHAGRCSWERCSWGRSAARCNSARCSWAANYLERCNVVRCRLHNRGCPDTAATERPGAAAIHRPVRRSAATRPDWLGPHYSRTTGVAYSQMPDWACCHANRCSGFSHCPEEIRSGLRAHRNGANRPTRSSKGFAIRATSRWAGRRAVTAGRGIHRSAARHPVRQTPNCSVLC